MYLVYATLTFTLGDKVPKYYQFATDCRTDPTAKFDCLEQILQKAFHSEHKCGKHWIPLTSLFYLWEYFSQNCAMFNYLPRSLRSSKNHSVKCTESASGPMPCAVSSWRSSHTSSQSSKKARRPPGCGIEPALLCKKETRYLATSHRGYHSFHCAAALHSC